MLEPDGGRPARAARAARRKNGRGIHAAARMDRKGIRGWERGAQPGLPYRPRPACSPLPDGVHTTAFRRPPGTGGCGGGGWADAVLGSGRQEGSPWGSPLDTDARGGHVDLHARRDRRAGARTHTRTHGPRRSAPMAPGPFRAVRLPRTRPTPTLGPPRRAPGRLSVPSRRRLDLETQVHTPARRRARRAPTGRLARLCAGSPYCPAPPGTAVWRAGRSQGPTAGREPEGREPRGRGGDRCFGLGGGRVRQATGAGLPRRAGGGARQEPSSVTGEARRKAGPRPLRGGASGGRAEGREKTERGPERAGPNAPGRRPRLLDTALRAWAPPSAPRVIDPARAPVSRDLGAHACLRGEAEQEALWGAGPGRPCGGLRRASLPPLPAGPAPRRPERVGPLDGHGQCIGAPRGLGGREGGDTPSSG